MKTGRHATGPSWLLPLSALLLLGGMIYTHHVVSQRQETLLALADTRSQLHEAKQAAQLQQQRETLQRAMDQLLALTRNSGLDPALWGQRQLDYRRSAMSRQDANRILAMLENTPGQWVDIDQFEISVVKPDMALFRPPAEHESPNVVLSISGMQYFSLQEDMP